MQIQKQWRSGLFGCFEIGIYLKAGERDDYLVWPFNMQVTFEFCSGNNKIKRILNCSSSLFNAWRNKPTINYSFLIQLLERTVL